MLKHGHIILLVIVSNLLISGCDKEPITFEPKQRGLERSDVTEQVAPLFDQYLSLAQSHYQDSLNESELLQQRIQQLLLTPDQISLDAAQQQWQQTHKIYLQGEFFHVSYYPSEVQTGISQTMSYSYQTNGWPVTPGYLDTIEGYPFSGIVNDITLPLTEMNIRYQHGLTDINDIAIGFHAIEFLLWGEQGQRHYTDFNPVTQLTTKQEQQGLTLIQTSNNRRRKYLAVITDALIKDNTVASEDWSSEGHHYKYLYKLPAPLQIEHLLNTTHKFLAEVLIQQHIEPGLHDDISLIDHSLFSNTTFKDQQNIFSSLRTFYRYVAQPETSEQQSTQLTFEQFLILADKDLGENISAHLQQADRAIKSLATASKELQQPDQADLIHQRLASSMENILELQQLLEQIALKLKLNISSISE